MGSFKKLGTTGIKPEGPKKTVDISKAVPVVQKSNFGTKNIPEFVGKTSPASGKKSKK